MKLPCSAALPLLSALMAGAFLLPSSAAAQDAEAGAIVFGRCAACHQVGPQARAAVGPPLNGIFGRRAGSYPRFNYGDALTNSGIVWDELQFRDYVRDPKRKIPGTRMVFPGMKDGKKIEDLIAFLKQFGPDGRKTPMP